LAEENRNPSFLFRMEKATSSLKGFFRGRSKVQFWRKERERKRERKREREREKERKKERKKERERERKKERKREREREKERERERKKEREREREREREIKMRRERGTKHERGGGRERGNRNNVHFSDFTWAALRAVLLHDIFLDNVEKKRTRRKEFEGWRV
jgi:hypothetical protein